MTFLPLRQPTRGRQGRREDVPVGLGPAASAHTLAARGAAAERLSTHGVLHSNSDETMTTALKEVDGSVP